MSRLSAVSSRGRVPSFRIGRGVASKATVLVLSLVLLIFLAFSAWIFVLQAATLEASTRKAMSDLGSATGLNVGNWLSGKLNLTEMAAQQIRGADDIAQIERVIASPALTNASVLSYFGDSEGHFHKTPKGPIAPGYDPRRRGWYQSVVALKAPTLSEPYVAASTQKLTITAAAPVQDTGGALIGVAANDFDLGVLSRMINEVDVGGLGYSYLVSGSGKILIHPKAELVGKPVTDLLAGAAPAIKPAVSETTENGRATLTTFIRIANLPRRWIGTSPYRWIATKRSRRCGSSPPCWSSAPWWPSW